MISDAIRNVAVPQEYLKSLETGLLRGGYEAEAARCCPIGLQETRQIPTTPESAAEQGKKPDEAMAPVMKECLEAKKHINQQGCPYLPTDSIGTVAQEVSQLQGLFDLLKKGFNRPTAAVKVGDTGRTPLQVVSQENHFLFNPVNLDQGGDPAHQFGVVGQDGGIAQGDDFITQDATSHRQRMKDFAGDVVFCAGDPENATLKQIKEMGEVQISLVEDDNLTGTNASTEFTGAFDVVLSGCINNGEAGQKAVEVEPQMALCRRFASPVLGPVHAGGDQLNGRGINHMDNTPETPGDPLASFATGKAGLESLQMAKHRPENIFRQVGISLLVGVREIIPAWWRRATERHEHSAVQTQPVTDVVKTDGMGELCINQANQMTPRAEGACFLVHTGLLRQLRNKIRWNEIANLPQDCKLTAAWMGFVFDHTCRMAGKNSHSKPFNLPAMGWCRRSV